MSRLPIKTISIVLLGGLLAVGCNWIYRVGLIRESASGEPRQAVFSSQPSFEFDQRWLGGLPLKYYAAVETPGSPPTVAFNALRLAGNIAIWAVLICVLAGPEYRSFLRSHQSGRMNATQDKEGSEAMLNAKTYGLSDLLVILIFLALLFSYCGSVYRESRAHRQLKVDLFESRNSAGMSIRLPAFLIGRLPLAISNWFARIDSISLYGASTDQLTHVLKIASPESLRLYGGDYDLRLLDEALADPYLGILEISGREIDANLIATIGAAKQLQFLGLSATNVTRASLNGLGMMPSLRSIDLEHTEFQLDSSETIPWSSTVQFLRLPRPAPGKSCIHRIVSWPSLQSVSCNGPLEYRNDMPVKLVLHELPNLKTISLDAIQIFDLDLKGLAALENVEPLRTNIQQRVVPGENVPELVWADRLVTEDIAIELESIVRHPDSR